MNYLKEMNQTNIGFEVIYYDNDLTYYTNLYDTEKRSTRVYKYSKHVW